MVPLCGALSAALVFVWKVHRNVEGPVLWAIGMGVVTGGSILMSFRGYIPHLASIVVANTLVVAGYALILKGIRAFQGVERGSAWEWSAVAIIFLSFLYFTYVRFDLNARMVIYSLITALLMFRCSFVVLAAVPIGQRGVYSFAAFGFSVLAGFLSLRTVLILIGSWSEAANGSFFFPNTVTVIMLFMHILGYVLFTLGLAILPGQRAKTALTKALEGEKAYSALQQKFVSLVSHEFRTPLTIIDASAQRIMRTRDKITPDQLVERGEKIRRAIERMVGLIESTLYASRLDAGKIEMHPAPCVLKDIIQEVCEHHTEIAPSHDIRHDLDGLPEQIVGDCKLLEHVFTNLLSNAVKYAPDAPLIEVRGWTENSHALIEIKDSGIGIPKEDLSSMFERYFRAKTAEGIQGTGIGLSVCKEFVELHGGEIGVDSQEGEGTTFTVQLPIDGIGQ